MWSTPVNSDVKHLQKKGGTKSKKKLCGKVESRLNYRNEIKFNYEKVFLQC